MVVLAVTWMAKIGHEAEVASLFEKLTEQSRKEPGCSMYQVHRHKTETRRFFIYEQYRDDAALEAHRERIMRLEKLVLKVRKLGFGFSTDVGATAYYRLEAQRWLEKAHAE